MILRKLNKLDYIKIKTYRSITFENIINKIMKNIMTKHINYLIETYELLSSYYYKDHSNRNTEDIMLIISKNIHQT